MTYQAINFRQKFGLFDEQWQPKVVAEMNDYQFKIVKLQGDFIWHDHKDTDETFIVLDGVLRIDFRDGAVRIAAGEMFVVPKGIEHKPYAEQEVKLLLIEPRGVLNTGHAGGEHTRKTTLGSDIDLGIARGLRVAADLAFRAADQPRDIGAVHDPQQHRQQQE
jgi:mannose-6-phosphate isomerase-like protein (cupin superfamily)